MSIECGECERDLRGGHAQGCSRHACRGDNAVACAKIRYGLSHDEATEEPCDCECHELDMEDDDA